MIYFDPVTMMFNLRKKFLNASSFFVGCVLISLFVNLAFNAYLGNRLSLAQYSLIAFISTLLNISNVVFGAISSTVTYHVGYLTSRFGKGIGKSIHNRAYRKLMIPVALFSIGWLGLSGQISSFFHIKELLPVIMFFPVFALGFFAAVSEGYLKGRFLFYFVGAIYLIEPLAKFALGSYFIAYHPELVYLAIPLATLTSSVLAMLFSIFISRNDEDHSRHNQKLSIGFFLASLLTSFSSVAFLS